MKIVIVIQIININLNFNSFIELLYLDKKIENGKNNKIAIRQYPAYLNDG